MLDRGLIIPIHNPKYGSAGFLVPKPNKPDVFRLVVDMRLLNENTKKSPLTMPNLEDLLRYTRGAHHFGCFDILSGFIIFQWQKTHNNILFSLLPLVAISS